MQESAKNDSQNSLENEENEMGHKEAVRLEKTIYYPEGSIYKFYTGSTKDGEPDGKGSLCLANGAHFVGMFEGGQFNGYGELFQQNGIIKKGIWKDGKLQGKAIFCFPEGHKIIGVCIEEKILHGTIIYPPSCAYRQYEGALNCAAPDGEGKMIFSDGAILIGNFAQGGRIMTGVYTSVDGVIVQGKWIGTKLQGEATMLYQDGRRVQGYAINGLVSYGVITYPPGHICKSYNGDLRNGLPHGKGQLTFADGAIYVGEFEGANSFSGTITRANGDIRKGTWQNGRLEGDVITNYINGTRVVGKFINGELSFGTLVFAEGSSYIGKFINGEFSFGTLVFAEGSSYKRYEGFFKDKKFHGEGKLTFADGEIYEGRFEEGKLISGKITQVDGMIIEGTWQGEELHGSGKIVYPCGHRIEGEFVEGVISFGTIIYEEGSIYSRQYKGSLKDDKPHGEGVVTFSDKSICKGRFEDGKFISGEGRWIYKDGIILEGTWENRRPHGKGTIIYSSGRRIEGEFVEGEISSGTIVYEEGSLYKHYVGSLKNEEPEGEGEVTFADGRVFNGTFKNGQPQQS